MPRKPYEFPERGELVVVKIREVNPHSALAELLEYPGKTGMIHVSEVARKWVRDIRNFVKLGQISVALVMNVEENKNFISLSLKRVSKKEAERKMLEFRREEKAEKMLELFAKEAGISLDEAYERVGFKLFEGFGEMYAGFLTALEKPELLAKKGISREDAELVKKIAERAVEIREREFKAKLEIRCYEGDGINRIRELLERVGKKFGVEVKYIAAPYYLLEFKERDAKKGERKLGEIEKFAERYAKELGCEFAMKRVE